jgi:sec-independent protein translocase protein TatA
MLAVGCSQPGRPRPGLAFRRQGLQNDVSAALRHVEWRESMGLAMSVPQLLIILVIVALIFGTKRLKEVGGDLGSAVKSFRKAMTTANEVADESVEPTKQLTSDEKEKTK